MISAGFFEVTEKVLARFTTKEQKLVFIAEMWNSGGRIGYDEFKRWETKILKGEL